MSTICRPPEKGIALVLVLWVLMLLTVIAGSYVSSMRTETLLARNLVAQAQARALADGAVQRGIHELLKPPTDTGGWKADGKPRTWEGDGFRIRLIIGDESGKIDINTASDTLLKGLFLSVGLGEPESIALLDAVLDWRDPDEARRPSGAEAAEYAAAGKKYIPANAAFEVVEEFGQVMGVSPLLYRKLQDALTVLSGQPGINPALASRQVLLAIPNAEANLVDNYIALRQDALESAQPVPPFPLASDIAQSGQPTAYTLRAEAALSSGESFVREAVVTLTAKQNTRRPYTVLSWKEGKASDFQVDMKAMDFGK
ncbi:MAG: type II secretion system protein GspK [Sulfuricellaceae bacterium]|nr:type II secretion system protein GspK [Sulfuricellaceae bacterium]